MDIRFCSYIKCRILLVSCVILLLGAGGRVSDLNAIAPKDDETPRFALLVGVSKYALPNSTNETRQITDIIACENNVDALEKTLIDDYGFDKDNIKRLVNQDAKRTAILGAFETHLVSNAHLAEKKGKEAAVVFYFCGHGSRKKDLDDDEDDGYDETLVAFDSGNTGIDILDDEIDWLKYDLRKHTSNATFLFESCHSGSASRTGDQESVAMVPESKVDHPFSWEKANKARTEEKKEKKERTKDQYAHRDTYVSISAAQDFQVAFSEKKHDDCVQPEACPPEMHKPLGFFTRALIQTLRLRRPQMSYWQLTRSIENQIYARGRLQNPKVEGNLNSTIFGAARIGTRPWIIITNLDGLKNQENPTVVIGAGAVHGVHKGSLVSIFSDKTEDYLDSEHLLASGRIDSVGATTSVVSLFDPKSSPKLARIDRSSRVIPLTPTFGSKQVTIDLDEENTIGKHAPIAQNVLEILRAEGLFENGSLIEKRNENSVSADARKLTLRRKAVGEIYDFSEDPSKLDPGKPNFSQRKTNLFPVACDGDERIEKTLDQRIPDKDRHVIFVDMLSNREGPLFGRMFDPEDSDLADKIAAVIGNYSHQLNLRSIENTASKLKEDVVVYVEPLNISNENEICQGSRLVHKDPLSKFTGSKLSVANFGSVEVCTNSYVRIGVKNVSGQMRKKDPIPENENRPATKGGDLFVNVLALMDTGEVRHVIGALDTKIALGDEQERSVVLKTTDFPGEIKFVVFITTSETDFSFVERRGSARNPRSFLESILTRPGSRNTGGADVSLTNWDVFHFTLARQASITCKTLGRS